MGTGLAIRRFPETASAEVSTVPIQLDGVHDTQRVEVVCESNALASSRRAARARINTLLLPLVCSLMFGGIELTRATAAQAQVQSDDDLAEQKAYWQNRYRDLLRKAALLRRQIEVEKELYADANRRNYRRGPVRHMHRDKALQAERDLVRVEEEIAGFSDEARRGGALPSWLYEVEDEPIEVPEYHSTPDEPVVNEDDDDKAGRNPLYLEEDDEP